MPTGARQVPYPEVTPDVLVDDTYTFEVGGERFEIIATPGGEGPDAVPELIRVLREEAKAI